MKIYQVQSNSIDHLRTNKAILLESPTKTRPSQKYSLSEVVYLELSRKLRLVQKASEVIAQTPEVRTEKLQTIRQAIQDNSYQIDSHKVADAIIAHAIMER